jgi:hypothetical protein
MSPSTGPSTADASEVGATTSTDSSTASASEPGAERSEVGA